MWWGTWSSHLKGWWERAQEGSNVLFVFFEDMKRDLPSTVRRVAEFLDVAPLSEEELANVVRKCGFSYMKEHASTFEMHPPHLLQADARLFVSGKADRHQDVPEAMRERVLAQCAEALRESGFPLEQAYPDVASAGS
jgi:estrone sulfotransferase